MIADTLRSKLDEEPAMMEKVEMENDGTAFVGNEGAGPGAEGYVAIGHLPSQNVDFRLRVMISNDGVSASDISSLGVVRSSPLLKKALKLLAIASSVKLSQSPTDSSASTARGTQPVKPSAIPNWNAQGIEKVSTQNSHQRVVPEPEPKAWKTFSLALVVAFSLLFLANYWKMRRNLKNRGEDHVK